MKQTWFAIPVLLVGCWLLATAAFAEPIPALRAVSAGLPPEVQAELSRERESLDKELHEFLGDAERFNAKPSEAQTETEFAALGTRRALYVFKANAFNRKVDAINKPSTGRAFTVGIEARGEFCITLADGRELAGHILKSASIDTGTRATTGPNGRLRFVLPDETVFTIGPNSDMVINDYVYDPAITSTLRKIAMNMTKGLFRFVTGKVVNTEPTGMKVTLPVADLGFRGTEAEIEVAPDGAGYVKLFSGEMEVTLKKTGVKFVVNAKHMVTFKADGTFSQPEPIIAHGGIGEK